MVAALFVAPRGPYFGRRAIDPWDERRDARCYAGPWPVVAHPPCSRWCQLAGLIEARYGHARGDDGGTFAAALSAVRTWGGVLEHPAWSQAWAAFGLSAPQTGGQWTRADDCGGWTCYVEQGRYGHPAKKATWLYAVDTDRRALRWGQVADRSSLALVSWCGNHVASGEARPRLTKRQASRTPERFRATLVGLARSVYPVRVGPAAVSERTG